MCLSVVQCAQKPEALGVPEAGVTGGCDVCPSCVPLQPPKVHTFQLRKLYESACSLSSYLLLQGMASAAFPASCKLVFTPLGLPSSLCGGFNLLHVLMFSVS